MLGAVSNSVHGSCVSMRKLFQATLEENDQLAFPRRRRTIEQEDAPSHIGTERRGFKIFHDFGQGLVDTEQIVLKKGVVFLTSLINAYARSVNHAVEPCVRPLCQGGLLEHEGQVIAKRALPCCHAMG